MQNNINISNNNIFTIFLYIIIGLSFVFLIFNYVKPVIKEGVDTTTASDTDQGANLGWVGGLTDDLAQGVEGLAKGGANMVDSAVGGGSWNQGDPLSTVKSTSTGENNLTTLYGGYTVSPSTLRWLSDASGTLNPYAYGQNIYFDALGTALGGGSFWDVGNMTTLQTSGSSMSGIVSSLSNTLDLSGGNLMNIMNAIQGEKDILRLIGLQALGGGWQNIKPEFIQFYKDKLFFLDDLNNYLNKLCSLDPNASCNLNNLNFVGGLKVGSGNSFGNTARNNWNWFTSWLGF